MENRDQVEKVFQAIRQDLQQHGGDVELVGVEDAVVKVRLMGACRGCPMSQETLRHGIERRLKEALPWVERVEAVDAFPGGAL